MNQITPYEQLIAAKLEQLPPLPAMADDIWLRISVRLDEDMPTDDDDFGGDDPESGPDGGSGVTPDTGWKGWSILLLLGALSLLIIYRAGYFAGKHIPVGNPETNYRILAPVQAGEAPDNNRNPGPLPTVQPQQPLARQPAASFSRPVDSTSRPVDSVFHPEQTSGGPVGDSISRAVAVPDTPVGAGLNIPLLLSPKIIPDSAAGRKRPSGVKGVGPDDYRILPRKEAKDST